MNGIILDAIVAISRLTQDATNTKKESYAPNLALSAVKCQIQPATPEETAVAEGVFGQTYIMFTTYSGIFSGDKVTVSGTGEAFRVRGVENWAQIEGAPHYEVTLVRMLEEEVIF